MSEVKRLYDKKPFISEQINEKRYSGMLASAREPFESFNDKRAIEIGCGGGRICLFLSKHFKHVTGVDLSDKSIELAEGRARPNTKFINGDLLDDRFIEALGEFDHVFCYGVLHHTPDPIHGLRNLKKLVKPGGKLTLGLYSRSLWWYRIKRKIVLMLAGGDQDKRMELADKLFYNGKGDPLMLSDGYANPIVSFWGIAQTYKLLEDFGFTYVGSVWQIEISAYPGIIKDKISGRPLNRHRKGNRLDYNGLSFMAVECLWALARLPVMLTTTAESGPD